MTSRDNRRRHTGFTIIEVVIFLAISGVLTVGILAGASTTVARYRYNDSVQSLAQFLRSQYSAVLHPQIPERAGVSDNICLGLSPSSLLSGGKIDTTRLREHLRPTSGSGAGNRGRTDCLIYGRVITFGGSNGEIISTSPLIGLDIFQLARNPSLNINIDELDDFDFLELSGANNLTVSYEDIAYNTHGNITNLNCYVRTPNGSSTHLIEWGARTRIVDPNNGNESSSGVMLIFRSPIDGAVRTYVFPRALPSATDLSAINSMNGGKGMGLQNPGNGTCNGNVTGNSNNGYAMLQSSGINAHLNRFRGGNIDLTICVDSDDTFAYGQQRRMIRIRANGRNSSAVELVDMDSTENRC